VSIGDVLRASEGVEVVLLGETHDDTVAHQLELYFLMSLQTFRATALSLEMFETDVQPVVDEYLTGLIREKDMLMDARPWTNYWTDYRPMVQFCKHAQLPVVAANAPRRFVGAAGRRGPGALQEEWPSRAAGWLPPLPLPQPSANYLTHLFNDAAFLSEASREQLGINLNAVGGISPSGTASGVQTSSGAGSPAGKGAGDVSSGGGGSGGGEGGGGGGGGGEGGGCPYIGLTRRDALLLPMLVWDASMACAIGRQLDSAPDQAVLHVCGSFHCEGKEPPITPFLFLRSCCRC
jgi:hypothetical protein